MTRTFRLAVATLATAALLTACSGGDGPTGDRGPIIGGTPTSAFAGTTAPAATTPAATATPIDPGRGDGETPADPADLPRCTTGELTGSYVYDDAGAGSQFWTLVLTNTGDRTCELTGFPGVSFVGGDDGHQIGNPADMSGETHGAVRLGTGGSAGAAMRMVNPQMYDAAQCRPETARGLRVYPPGDTASLFVPWELTACSATDLPDATASVQAVAAR